MCQDERETGPGRPDRFGNDMGHEWLIVLFRFRSISGNIPDYPDSMQKHDWLSTIQVLPVIVPVCSGMDWDNGRYGIILDIPELPT